jgi:[ribosomal protein S5]-alanine N-acetyltransferase
MQFNVLPESDHPLVVLRPLVKGDLPQWSNYLLVPAVHEHTSWTDMSVAALSRHLTANAEDSASSPLRLAIASRSDDGLVGTIGFHTVWAEHRSAELAYDLAPHAWGKGIAVSLCRTMVEWAHAAAGIQRVQATVLNSNARSIRVLERVGFSHEGLLRGYRLVRGSPGDFHMYAHVAGMPSNTRWSGPQRRPFLLLW